jgi:biopolymer transport protein ExbD
MKFTRRKLNAEVPSVAMGDIAFNLLVFFVILARAQDDSHIQWQPAVSKRVEATEHGRVTVLIDKESRLYLNGQELGVAQLSGRISELLGNDPAGKRWVKLKVHKEATAQRFEPVIEAISEAGGDLVHILQKEQ